MIVAESDGWLSVDDCGRIGMAAALLSGGHLGNSGAVERGSGLVMKAKHGKPVRSGEPLIELYYSDKNRLEAARAAIARAIRVVNERPPVNQLIYG